MLAKLILLIFSFGMITGVSGEVPTSTIEYSNSDNTTIINSPTNQISMEMKTTPVAGDTIALVTTNMGSIKVLLYTKETPESTKNFIELSKAGKYNGVIFHRVIKDFMIQTGDFEYGNGTGGYSYKGPGTTLDDELVVGLNHIYGAVSMAKTAMPDTAGSQFFIVQNKLGTPHLDGVHSVFGFVYEGMDTVEKIADVDVAGSSPIDAVKIEKIEISTYK